MTRSCVSGPDTISGSPATRAIDAMSVKRESSANPRLCSHPGRVHLRRARVFGNSAGQSLGRGGFPPPLLTTSRLPALCLFLLHKSDFLLRTLCSELGHSGPDSNHPGSPRLAWEMHCVFTKGRPALCSLGGKNATSARK